MMKECNPKLKAANKICNPKTGRWVLRTSKTGKEIIAEVRTPVRTPALKFNYGSNSKYKDILLSIFNKNRKKGTEIYSINKIGTSRSRTKAELYSASLKFSNPNAVVKKYGIQESHRVHTFLKITKIRKS